MCLLNVPTADCTAIAPIINNMLLLGNFRNPVQKYTIWSPSTLTTALITTVANNETSVVFKVNTAPVFVDCARFTVMDFAGLNITGSVHHINTHTTPGVVGAGIATGTTPSTTAQVVTAAAVTANAAN